jgi:hypothetical protein
MRCFCALFESPFYDNSALPDLRCQEPLRDERFSANFPID